MLSFRRVCNQWLGESWLRSLMEGRIVLVKLLCKDTANTHIGVFSPCIAFRVAGSPGTVYARISFFTSLAYILLLPHLLLTIGVRIINRRSRQDSSIFICNARDLLIGVHLSLSLSRPYYETLIGFYAGSSSLVTIVCFKQ